MTDMSAPGPAGMAAFLLALGERFQAHPERHPGLGWDEVRARIEASPRALDALWRMEATGGEPDAIGSEPGTGAIVYCDCSPESPAGRRSLCYDREAWDSRKDNKPQGSALDLAAAMGVSLLDEEGYRALQALGAFDQKTSSWLLTPAGLRAQGGALFGDRRYGRVFTYHNGAESYYAVRGFRAAVKV